ncbi:MAG: hypothetical protein KR126chlam6_00781, partial [Candidatus Anoxychlamydiales bacterium]|nr:hypothetical protein [Candidatus Anoxychlamydiales bacterium]
LMPLIIQKFTLFLKNIILFFLKIVNIMSNDFVWRAGRSCVFKNFVHVVFIAKYRQNIL